MFRPILLACLVSLAALGVACGTSTSPATPATDAGAVADVAKDVPVTGDATGDADAGQDGADAKADASADASADAAVQSVDDFIKTRLDTLFAPGLAAAIVKDGKVVWSKGYGVADVEKQSAVTADTVFFTSTLSGTVTGVAVMQLVEAGKLNLDEDVNKYLPFKVTNSFVVGKVTLRMLLAWAASIQDNYGMEEFDGPLTRFMTEDFLFPAGDSTVTMADFFAGYLVPGGKFYAVDNYVEATPGTETNYSEVSVALAGYIVEVVAKQPFDQYCQDKIFTPLGMTHSTFREAKVDKSKLALGYTLDENDDYAAYEPYGVPWYPATTLYTSVGDYAKFLAAFAKGGAPLVSKASFLESTKVAFPDATDGEAQGLVWIAAELDSGEVMGVEGGDFGYSAAAWFDPKTGTGVVTFTNSEFYLDYDPEVQEEQDALDAAYEIVGRLFEEAAKF